MTVQRTSLGSALILPLILVSACGPDTDAPSGDVVTTYDTINGVIHVTNAGTPPRARLVPVVSIGPRTLADTGSPEEFGGVNSVALGPDGEVFVADGRNFEVRVFGLDGSHRRTFGRQGGGPGEFSDLYSLVWVGDRLLTLDPAQGRITEFSADGVVLGSRRIPGGTFGPLATVRFYPVGPDETFLHALDAQQRGREGPVFVTKGGAGTIFVGHDSRGETRDTIRWTTGRPTPRAVIVCQNEEGMTLFTIPFVAESLQVPGPGGVMYTAMTDVYRISVIRSRADTLRVIERPLSPELVSDSEWDSELEEFWEFSERANASCDPDRPSRPNAKPFIRGMYVATDGKLWVEIFRAAGNLWEIYDVGGRLLGGVSAPPRKEGVVPAFGPDQLVTIRQDSLDLDYVDIWSLERHR